ncbi:MAG: phage tail tape measure C-terminal domain-containing protein, partial [Henriciella sp.]
MREFDKDIDLAVAALSDLVETPARAASEIISLAFDDAGIRIEQSLARAARSGELDFRRMAENILSDITKIAAEIAILRVASPDTGGVPG